MNIEALKIKQNVFTKALTLFSLLLSTFSNAVESLRSIDRRKTNLLQKDLLSGFVNGN